MNFGNLKLNKQNVVLKKNAAARKVVILRACICMYIVYHDMSSICLLYEKKKTMPFYALRRMTGIKGI